MFDPLHTTCDKGWVFAKNEGTMDYHHASALKLKNTYRQHKRSLVYLAQWFSKYGSKPKGWRMVKKGLRRGDPNRSCVFSTLPLLVCVCL